MGGNRDSGISSRSLAAYVKPLLVHDMVPERYIRQVFSVGPKRTRGASP